MLHLPGQTGEAGKASQKQCAFGNRRALDRKFLLPFFCLSGCYKCLKTTAVRCIRKRMHQTQWDCTVNVFLSSTLHWGELPTPRSWRCIPWYWAPFVPVVFGLGGYGGLSGHGDEQKSPSFCRQSNICHLPKIHWHGRRERFWAPLKKKFSGSSAKVNRLKIFTLNR